MIKVFIVDDHEIIREGLKQILMDENDIQVVGEARDGKELLQKLKHVDSDIVIMDLNLQGKNGNDVIKDMKRRKIKSKVLVLTISPEQHYALKSFKAGAAGFVDKSVAIDDLVTAIRAVYEKGRYMSPAFAEQLAFDSLTSSTDTKQQLTYNELKFAILLNEGHDIKDIATDLGMDPANAVVVKRKIFKKLNVKSYLDLMHYFQN